MTAKTLLNTPHYTVKHIPEQNALLAVWNGYTSDRVYMNAIDRIISLMVEHNINKTLHDISKHKGISPKSQKYAAKRSIEFNRNYWSVKRAIVLPPNHDIFSKFAVKNFVNEAKKQDTSQDREFFPSLEDALSWLYD